MIKHTRVIGTGLVLAIALTLVTSSAKAQGASEKAVIQLNQKAMKAFRKGKVGVAIKRLDKALLMCTQNNLRGRALTTTYLHFGVVEADGNQNNSVAMDYFKQALCENPKVSLKGINAKPETTMLFKLVKKQVKKPGQCPSAGGQPAAAAPVVRSQPLPAGTVTQTDLIFHQSVVEQKSLTPVPIYVEVNPSYPIGEVILYYRTMGEKIFQQVPMKPHAKGRAAIIGCDVMQTFNPSGIEYYIGVLDHASQLLGTSGTEAQPHMVTIVQVLSGPPPALPESEPPSACAAECPPWDPSCNQNCKQHGDMCDSSKECCSGMVCLDEMCTPSDDDYSSGGETDAVMRIGLTFGGGAGLLPGKTVQPYNQTSATPQVAMDDAVANGGVVNTGALETGTGIALNKFNIRLSAMYYVTPKFLIGASFRGGLALDNSGASEVMTVAPTILANVAYQIAGANNEKFEMTALMGLGGGVIQYRVPYRDCNEYIINDPGTGFEAVTTHPWYDGEQYDQYQTACHRYALDTEERWAETGGGEWYGTNAWDGQTDWIEKTYFRKAGNLVVELGLDMNFWFAKGFGLNIGLISDVYFVPDFALNLDLQLGPVFRF